MEKKHKKKPKYNVKIKLNDKNIPRKVDINHLFWVEK